MTDLSISPELAEQLQAIAQREHRSLEDVLATMVAHYAVSGSAELPPRPIADEEIEVPDDVSDQAAYRAAVRQMRPKLYQIARRYWQSVGDTEHLALTDEALDHQFWLIDADGVPHLKSERGSIALPPDPLEALVGIIDEAPADLSASVRETMAAHYRAKTLG